MFSRNPSWVTFRAQINKKSLSSFFKMIMFLFSYMKSCSQSRRSWVLKLATINHRVSWRKNTKEQLLKCLYLLKQEWSKRSRPSISNRTDHNFHLNTCQAQGWILTLTSRKILRTNTLRLTTSPGSRMVVIFNKSTKTSLLRCLILSMKIKMLCNRN